MTVVNTETGEVLDPVAATRLTSRIRLIAESLADNLDKLAILVQEAQETSAHVALGYRSWTEYVSAEFGGILPRLDREPRRQLIASLAETGMSTRAIAPIAGVDNATVHRDLSRVANATPPTSSALPETHSQGDVQHEADEDDAATVAASRPKGGRAQSQAEPLARPAITGLDGKTYTKPAPKADPLGDYIDSSQDLQDKRYLTKWAEATEKAGAFLTFDADRVGRVGDDHDIRTLELHLANAQRFLDKMRVARSGLRVITGGKS